MNPAFNGASVVPLRGSSSGGQGLPWGSASAAYAKQLTNRTYLLQILQQPTTGATHGYYPRSHLQVSLPLVLQLKVFDCRGELIAVDEELPSLVARLDLLTEHATPMPIESSTSQSLLGGSTMASPQMVVDQQGTRGYFLFFGLISIRASGRYRLGVSLTVETGPLNIHTASDSARCLAQAITDTFEVFQQLESTVAPTPSPVHFSPQDWSRAGCRDLVFCKLGVHTLPHIALPARTDLGHISSLGLISYGFEPFGENPPNVSRELNPPHNQPDHVTLHHNRKTKSYDRPGKKPAVPYERDPLELQKHCKRRGGRDFAVKWITVAFKRGVSLDALVRTLDLTEVENSDRGTSNGFKLRQAYDGFIEKTGHHFECGLCEEGNRTHWVHKKDAVRHLRKFHFGLADRCRVCCQNFYSKSELRKHRCVCGAA